MFPEWADEDVSIGGFGWHQGWNDGCDENMTAAYESNLANLIQDLREEWKQPTLPISIPVSGFTAMSQFPKRGHRSMDLLMYLAAGQGTVYDAEKTGRFANITAAQFAVGNPAKHPELGGHVSSMETRGFWREPRFSADSSQSYHYRWNAETHALIGQAMATGVLKAMTAMI